MRANILSLMNYSSSILVSFSDHNFHSEKKNLVQTVVWVESRLAKCMYCGHTRNNLLWQLEATIFIPGLIYSRTADFKCLSAITTMPDHQSNKT